MVGDSSPEPGDARMARARRRAGTERTSRPTAAAIPTAVATSGYIALAHEVARDFYPRPDVRFVPFAGAAPEIAVVTRADDERPTIAALQRAAHFARSGSAPPLPAAGKDSRRNG